MICFQYWSTIFCQKSQRWKGVQNLSGENLSFYRKYSVTFSGSHSGWTETRIWISWLPIVFILVTLSTNDRRSHHHDSALYLYQYLSNTHYVTDTASVFSPKLLQTQASSLTTPSPSSTFSPTWSCWFYCLDIPQIYPLPPTPTITFLVQVILTLIQPIIAAFYTISKVICLWYLKNKPYHLISLLKIFSWVHTVNRMKCMLPNLFYEVPHSLALPTSLSLPASHWVLQ